MMSSHSSCDQAQKVLPRRCISTSMTRIVSWQMSGLRCVTVNTSWRGWSKRCRSAFVDGHNWKGLQGMTRLSSARSAKVELWRTVILGDIHWPVPETRKWRKQHSRRVHDFTSPKITSIQRSKLDRLRLTASVSSTPLKWMESIEVCNDA